VTPITNSSQQLDLVRRLTPLRRTVVCDDFDASLAILGEHMPLEIVAIPSGTDCWTWRVPQKWTLGRAQVFHESGTLVLDGCEHPLAVAPYSQPFDGEVNREELIRHLRWSEKWPDSFVYEYRYTFNFRLSDWCLSMPHERVKGLPEGRYRVNIEATRSDGSLKIGQCLLPGRLPETVVIVSHLCHPGQANDGVSGIAGLARLWAELAARSDRQFSYLFLAPPETLGSVAWLWARQDMIPRLSAGIDLEMLGVDNQLVLKLSHKGDHCIDRVARHALAEAGVRVVGFREAYGNDEMVFADPDFDVPIVAVQHYPFPEYHTSRDDPSSVHPARLDEAHRAAMAIIDILENDYVPQRRFQGPLYLSRFGLYVDTHEDRALHRQVWNIMQRLGTGRSVFQIAEEVGLPFWHLHSYLKRWEDLGLLARAPSPLLSRQSSQ
jgi:aminopeptidase-like protein